MGSTCVLKTPFNSTLDQLAQTLNPNANDSKTLAARYFDPMCLDSFTQGVPLSNFVPPPPSPAPSDDPDPDPRFQDGLWNFTVAPPTTVQGECGSQDQPQLLGPQAPLELLLRSAHLVSPQNHRRPLRPSQPLSTSRCGVAAPCRGLASPAPAALGGDLPP